MTSEWKETTLEDCTSLLGDGLHGTPQYTQNGEYAFVNGNNLVNGRIIIKSDTKRVNRTQFEKYKKELCDRTIMVSINGTLGNVALYNGEKIILGKSACYFNVLESVDKDFIRYVVSSPSFRTYLETNATGTTIKNISLKQMRDYSFYIPGYETQKRISGILRFIDDRISLNTAINENLELQAQAIFIDLFITNAKPEWKMGTISDLGNVVGGGTPSKKVEEYYTNDGIAWITPKDLSNDKSKFITHGETDITDLGLAKSSATLMPRGSVLFSSRAPIGYIAIADGQVSTNQGFKSIVPFDNVGTAYVYYFLKENLSAIENVASGSTFKEVSGGTMKNFPAVIPDDDTLAKFKQFCSPLLEQQRALEYENRYLASLRDTLLPKLMNGEIDVSEIKI